VGDDRVIVMVVLGRRSACAMTKYSYQLDMFTSTSTLVRSTHAPAS
jgi:hypothetical protein